LRRRSCFCGHRCDRRARHGRPAILCFLSGRAAM